MRGGSDLDREGLEYRLCSPPPSSRKERAARVDVRDEAGGIRGHDQEGDEEGDEEGNEEGDEGDSDVDEDDEEMQIATAIALSLETEPGMPGSSGLNGAVEPPRRSQSCGVCFYPSAEKAWSPGQPGGAPF